uniref:NaTx n=1 Tax=Centruroides hentzi TaxID=88313 RepID=A0A2I9LPC1_9SCOR
MNYFILILVAAILILDVNCKDGYPIDGNACRYECWKNEYCDKLCKDKKGKDGYCYGWNLMCWCNGLPDKEAIKTNQKCNGKRK